MAQVHGTRVGYDHPGYHLTTALLNLQPYDFLDDYRWGDALECLEQSVVAGIDNEVIDWFCHWLPRCISKLSQLF